MVEIGSKMVISGEIFSNLSEFLRIDQLNGQPATSTFLEFLYLSYMPICAAIGLIGNGLVWILITSNQIFRRLPSSAYLLTLAVMSSAFLISLLSFWIEEGFVKNQPERHSRFLCKCATYVAHVCDFGTVWMIVLIGFERLTLLYKVTFRRSIVHSRRQVVVLLAIATISNAWILFVADVNEFGGCDINADYERIYNIFSLFETVLCMLIPTVFIIVSNVLVILKLRNHFKRIPSSSPSVSFNTADVVFSGGPTTQTIRSTKISKLASLHRLSSRLSIGGRTENHDLIIRNNRRQSIRYTDLQLTRSLVIITSAFIVLNLPNYIYRIGVQLHLTDHLEVMHILRLIAHLLLYTHHALIFFVYIFNSPQMRKRLVPTAWKLLESTFDRGDYGNIAQKLRNLNDDSFFGMKFVLNITGKRCIPKWNFPKPNCWGHGWPWPWPKPPKTTTKHGQTTTTTRKTTAQTTTTTTTRRGVTYTSTVPNVQTSTTTNQRTSTTPQVTSTTTTTQRTSTGAAATSPNVPTTSAVSTTGAVTQNTPTSPSGGLETTTCQYAMDLQDDAYCKDIRGVAQGSGALQKCKPYFDNATIWQFYEECRQFQCKYQRAYRCYGMLPFVNNCSAQLPEDESLYGWREYNFCDANSTPFPAITFTDIPSTEPTVAVGKRHANQNDNDDDSKSAKNKWNGGWNNGGWNNGGWNNGGGKSSEQNDDSNDKSNGNSIENDDSEEATDEGTTSPADGIKHNWCVPQIFSWWYKNGNLPGKKPNFIAKNRRRRHGRKGKGKKGKGKKKNGKAGKDKKDD
ncbi:G-PROTEIN-RECEP-F1-2 domain-containing protein [Aphelenchoides besseyi]|nr:G-PROTEIN-RECEP-F1-2 domain-containing protein [Aphelenchoides besseyi]